jgi:hypothetical protein
MTKGLERSCLRRVRNARSRQIVNHPKRVKRAGPDSHVEPLRRAVELSSISGPRLGYRIQEMTGTLPPVRRGIWLSLPHVGSAAIV